MAFSLIEMLSHDFLVTLFSVCTKSTHITKSRSGANLGLDLETLDKFSFYFYLKRLGLDFWNSRPSFFPDLDQGSKFKGSKDLKLKGSKARRFKGSKARA